MSTWHAGRPLYGLAGRDYPCGGGGSPRWSVCPSPRLGRQRRAARIAVIAHGPSRQRRACCRHGVRTQPVALGGGQNRSHKGRRFHECRCVTVKVAPTRRSDTIGLRGQTGRCSDRAPRCGAWASGVRSARSTAARARHRSRGRFRRRDCSIATRCRPTIPSQRVSAEVQARF
jgi:hypothetical protein